MTPRFDIVDLVTRTYRLIYLERAYLARLALIPIFIMFINFVAVTTVFPDVPLLRRGLMLLPAMMAEAWLVAQFMRTVMTGERWPMRLPPGFSGPVPPALVSRVRGLLSGMIFYLLVTLLINGVAGVMGTMLMTEGVGGKIGPNADLTPAQDVLALVLSVAVVVMVFNFRLMWLYLPLIVNMPVRVFLARTGGTFINFHLIGAWLATVLPVMALGMLVVQPIMGLTQGEGMGAFMAFLVFAFLNVVFQASMALVASCGIAAALSPFIFGNKEQTPL